MKLSFIHALYTVLKIIAIIITIELMFAGINLARAQRGLK